MLPWYLVILYVTTRVEITLYNINSDVIVLCSHIKEFFTNTVVKDIIYIMMHIPISRSTTEDLLAVYINIWPEYFRLNFLMYGRIGKTPIAIPDY